MGFVLYSGVSPGGNGDRIVAPLSEGFAFLFTTPNEAVVEASFETVTYLKVSSFMYSLTNITALAVPFILKDSLLMSPVHMGLFGALLSIPSFVKPLVTLWIAPKDRPSTLAICAAIQTSMYVGVATNVANPLIVCTCLFGHSIASAIGMVLRDTMLVEQASAIDDEHHSSVNLFADVAMISRFGLLPVSYLSGYVLTFATPAMVVGCAAVCPAIVCISALFLTPPTRNASVSSSDTLLASAVSRIRNTEEGFFSTTAGRGLALSLVPSYTDTMFFYYTQVSGFTPEFLGRFQFLGAIAGILGNGISRKLAPSVNLRSLANAATIVTIPVLFSNLLLTTNSIQSVLHVSTGLFVLSRHFLLDFLASLTALPAAVQLMRTAPKGAQGTYLALVGTMTDLGGMVNAVLSSATMSALGIGSHSFANITSLLALSNSLATLASPLVMYTNETKEVEQSNERKPAMDLSPRDA